LQMWIISSLQY